MPTSFMGWLLQGAATGAAGYAEGDFIGRQQEEVQRQADEKAKADAAKATSQAGEDAYRAQETEKLRQMNAPAPDQMQEPLPLPRGQYGPQSPTARTHYSYNEAASGALTAGREARAGQLQPMDQQAWDERFIMLGKLLPGMEKFAGTTPGSPQESNTLARLAISATTAKSQDDRRAALNGLTQIAVSKGLIDLKFEPAIKARQVLGGGKGGPKVPSMTKKYFNNPLSGKPDSTITYSGLPVSGAAGTGTAPAAADDPRVVLAKTQLAALRTPVAKQHYLASLSPDVRAALGAQ